MKEDAQVEITDKPSYRLIDILTRDGLRRPLDGARRCIERSHGWPRGAPAVVRQHGHDVAT